MSEAKYDNAYGPNNAYGHCVELLRRRSARSAGVHLDLACGLAPIAEPLIDSQGGHYVGLDFDPSSVEMVRSRGLEAHVIDLNDDQVGSRLAELLGGRPLASVSILDGLEHLTDGSHVMRAIASLIAEHQAICVISVPNVTHLDVAGKALLGSWTYTPTGLLDETHYRLFSHTSLLEFLAAAGLACVDTYDVVMPKSDQHFPSGHPALTAEAPLGQFLRLVRSGADAHADTNQFVWALAPVPPKAPVSQPETRPAVSVVVRTQAAHVQELRELMLCLQAQTSPDFEVVLVAERLPVERQISIEEVIVDQPDDLRDRVRLVLFDGWGAVQALNHGLTHAAGQLLTVVDECDLVMAGWIASLAEQAARHPGQMLRVQSVAQAQERVLVAGLPVLKPIDSPLPGPDVGRRFSLVQHLVENRTPASTWAFPRTLMDDLGLRFDPTLHAGAGWDLIVRGAELAGMVDIDAVSVIRRSLPELSPWGAPPEDGTQTSAPPDELARTMSRRPLLLPAGSVSELETLVSRDRQLTDQLAGAELQLAQLRRDLADGTQQVNRLRRRLRAAQADVQPRQPNGRARAAVARVRRAGARVKRFASGPDPGPARRGGGHG